MTGILIKWTIFSTSSTINKTCHFLNKRTYGQMQFFKGCDHAVLECISQWTDLVQQHNLEYHKKWLGSPPTGYIISNLKENGAQHLTKISSHISVTQWSCALKSLNIFELLFPDLQTGGTNSIYKFMSFLRVVWEINPILKIKYRICSSCSINNRSIFLLQFPNPSVIKKKKKSLQMSMKLISQTFRKYQMRPRRWKYFWPRKHWNQPSCGFILTTEALTVTYIKPYVSPFPHLHSRDN